MRILKMVLMGLAVAGFVSCQKELSLENPNGTPPPGPGPDTLGQLLVREVTTYSSVDSAVSVYTYDASRKLVGINSSGTISGNNISNVQTIKRDGSGIITQVVSTSAQAGGTLVTNVVYDAASGTYTYAIIKYTVGGVNYIDSTVFVYDASNRIVQAVDYAADPTNGYALYYMNQFTYSGNSIDSAKFFMADTSGALTWVSANVYSYDNAVNPLILDNGDAIILGLPELYSPNNVAQLKKVDLSNAANTTTVNTTYTLNTKNKPVTSNSAYTNGGATYTGAYYYQ